MVAELHENDAFTYMSATHEVANNFFHILQIFVNLSNYLLLLRVARLRPIVVHNAIVLQCLLN